MSLCLKSWPLGPSRCQLCRLRWLLDPLSLCRFGRLAPFMGQSHCVVPSPIEPMSLRMASSALEHESLWVASSEPMLLQATSSTSAHEPALQVDGSDASQACLSHTNGLPQIEQLLLLNRFVQIKSLVLWTSCCQGQFLPVLSRPHRLSTIV